MRSLALPALVLATPFALAAARMQAGQADAARGGVTAVHAGTVHLVEEGRVIEGGATLVMRRGRIVSIEPGRNAPPGAQVVDYGPDAVIIPGLVSANSTHAPTNASQRTADPGVAAIDSFDPYSRAYVWDVSGGVTSAYLPPARNRLLAGQGAVVKLAGEDPGRRVLSSRAVLQGSIGADARNTPGFWEPPVPASVETGLGFAKPQLPGSTMGAIVALRELVASARSGEVHEEYGAEATLTLAELMGANVPWRIQADRPAEIRSLLAFAQSERLPLIVDGCSFAGDVAAELASAGASAIVKVDVRPQAGARDQGREKEDRWPDYEVAARLVEAGVPTALSTRDDVRCRELRFVAQVALRGGMSPEAALRGITLVPAQLLGVADRVGSLAPGKDADFVVLNGPPLSVTSTVVATWIDGEAAWKAIGSSGSATVLEVDELHVGDGSVLRPGQVLMQDGRIAEVGSRVAHPIGATVVRGTHAMPGMIDALGHLGLEGSGRSPATDFKLARIVEPADEADLRVARAGVTTVLLCPRGSSSSGIPIMAYKPAGADLAKMVIADPAALRLTWTDRNRIESGKGVRDLLEKAVAYDKKWKDYEAALAKWVPPAETPAPAATEKKEEPKESKEEAKKEEPKEPKDDKKKGEKGGEKKAETDPLPGIWEAKVTVPPFEEPAPLRMRLEVQEGRVVGSLRCAQVGEGLILLAGTAEGAKLTASGIGSRGMVVVTGEAKEGKLEGELKVGEESAELKAERTSQELPRAERPERRRVKAEPSKEIKGKPQPPGTDEKLEPLRRAMRGEAAVIVEVDRREEIRACVEAFQKAGIQPILYGADDAWRIAGELTGRVKGLLLSPAVLEMDPREGLNSLRNRYALLSAAGIPFAFQSQAEEGAAELALIAAYAISQGVSPEVALQGVTAGAARMLAIDKRVGRIAPGLDADVLLLDGPPLEPGTRVERVWVNGAEVR